VSKILVGKGEQPVYLLAKYGNRHGLAGGRILAPRRAGVHGRREGRRGRPGENIRQRAAMAKQAARTVGSQIGRQILRGVLGGILGGSRR